MKIAELQEIATRKINERGCMVLMIMAWFWWWWFHMLKRS